MVAIVIWTLQMSRLKMDSGDVARTSKHVLDLLASPITSAQVFLLLFFHKVSEIVFIHSNSSLEI